MHNALSVPISSQRINNEPHAIPHGIDLCHKIAPNDLFPKMLVAFEHIQDIVQRGHKGASHNVGRALSKSENHDVNHSSVFLRRGDEQKIANVVAEESRQKRRKTYDGPQTDVFHTYDKNWIGKRASSSIRHSAIGHYTPTRNFGNSNQNPSTTWHTPILMPAHQSPANRKILGGSMMVEGSDVGTSEAFLQEYIKVQANDEQPDMRWTLVYR